MDELEFLKEQGLVPSEDNQNNIASPEVSEQPSGHISPNDNDGSAQAEGSKAGEASSTTDDYYRKILGDWADPDKAVLIPERLSKYDQLVQEIDEIKKKSSPAFANDSVAKFNSFVQKTGISDYGVFQRLEGFNPEQATSTEKLAMQMILENPVIAGKYEFDKVVKLVEKKYNIDPDLDPNDDDAQFGQMSIDLEAAKADKFLSQVKNELSSYSYQQAPELDFEKLESDWSPVVKSISDKFSKIDIKFDEKSEETDFEYHVDANARQQIADETLKYLVGSGAEINEQSISTAKEIISNRYKVMNFGKILKAYKAKMESDFVKRSAQDYNNPSDLINPDANKAAPSGEQKSAADKVFELEMQSFS
jgi:hypothetical protein